MFAHLINALSIFLCPSWLLLDAFTQGWEDAVDGAAASCSSQLANRIPVSRQQEGATNTFKLWQPFQKEIPGII